MLVRIGTFFLFVATMFVGPAMIAATANAFEADAKATTAATATTTVAIAAPVEHRFDRGLLESVHAPGQ